MKDMGELHFILGMGVEWDKRRGTVKLQQTQYIKRMLRKFGMADANPVSTPADTSVKLIQDDGMSTRVGSSKYQSMVGSLLWAAISTRPDIAQAVSTVSRFNKEPSQAHLTAVKRILRYLKGTADLGIVYGPTSGTGLVDSPTLTGLETTMTGDRQQETYSCSPEAQSAGSANVRRR